MCLKDWVERKPLILLQDLFSGCSKFRKHFLLDFVQFLKITMINDFFFH